MTSEDGQQYNGGAQGSGGWSPAPYGAQAPYGGQPGGSAPYGMPEGQPYQQPAPGAPYPGPYGPPQGYPYAPPRSTNGLAIASMVLGILWLYWIGSVLALVFGYIARRQIRERGENGGGMATAGIVLGWIGVGVLVLVAVLGIVAGW
jgi:hypothetical protein